MVLACWPSRGRRKRTAAKSELEASECVARGNKFWWLAGPCAWATGGPEESHRSDEGRKNP
jgi:hypothetical protein